MLKKGISDSAVEVPERPGPLTKARQLDVPSFPNHFQIVSHFKICDFFSSVFRREMMVG